MQLAKINPEEKALSQDSLESMGVKELRNILRQCNAARNYGVFNEQFREWILNNESLYVGRISDILKIGTHKVQLMYYAMIYTILDSTGCYLRGKSSSPIGISRSKYCELLNLENRLKSKNIRKTIANDFYGHNFMLAIESRKAGKEVLNLAPELRALEPVCEDIAYAIDHNFMKI